MKDRLLVASSHRVFRVLTAWVVLLTALSATGWTARLAFDSRLHGLARVFDVNQELSLPTWYSILGLAASALLLALIARILRARDERAQLAAWTTLAGGFLLMSLEELIGFHEKLSEFLHAHWRTDGLLVYGWVAAALILMPILGAGFRGFIQSLEPRRRRQFLLAGAIYLGGAVVMEMIGGKVLGAQDRPVTAAYALCFHIEECMEMLGIVLFNCALIEHLAELLGEEGLTLRFSRARDRPRI